MNEFATSCFQANIKITKVTKCDQHRIKQDKPIYTYILNVKLTKLYFMLLRVKLRNDILCLRKRVIIYGKLIKNFSNTFAMQYP